MNNIKFEVPQIDGITVKERIIRFFLKSNVLDRESAEMLYNAAESAGFQNGAAAFDTAITFICNELALDDNELAKEIQSMTS